jgi:hypothetical protein
MNDLILVFFLGFEAGALITILIMLRDISRLQRKLKEARREARARLYYNLAKRNGHVSYVKGCLDSEEL